MSLVEDHWPVFLARTQDTVPELRSHTSSLEFFGSSWALQEPAFRPAGFSEQVRGRPTQTD